MNQVLIRNILLLICILLLGGCSELRQYSSESGDLHVPSDTNYLLSCLNDMQDIGPEEFTANFEMAENGLQRGREQD